MPTDRAAYFRAYQKARYQANREAILEKTRIQRAAKAKKEKGLKYLEKTPELKKLTQGLHYYAREKARNGGVKFNLVASDIEVTERCPLLETKLELSGTGPNADAPVLITLRPNEGFVAGNVMVVSRRASNILKQLPLERMRKFLKVSLGEG